MVLRTLGRDAISMKTPAAAVQIKANGDFRINDKNTEGPGEYDVAGVGVHIYNGYLVLFTEGVRIAVLWDPTAKIDAEDETNIDAFVFFTSDVKQINTVIKEQDPRLAVFTDEAIANEVTQLDGVSLSRESNYKVTAATLPVEDRQFVALVS